MINSGAEKNILSSEICYLNTLGNLFPILVHWEIYNLWVITGYSIAYVNTWGSSPTPLIASHIYYVQVRIILQSCD